MVLLKTSRSRAHAEEAGERIRKAFNNTSFDMDRNQIKSTVSIGIGSYPEDTDSADDVLNKADRALYKSKREGRNQVCATDDSDRSVSYNYTP